MPMGRRGRHAFLDHWHRRNLERPDGHVLRWVLMDDPARAPIAEAFRRSSPDITSRGVHPTEARRLLAEHEHLDAELVSLDEHVGHGAFH